MLGMQWNSHGAHFSILLSTLVIFLFKLVVLLNMMLHLIEVLISISLVTIHFESLFIYLLAICVS